MNVEVVRRLWPCRSTRGSGCDKCGMFSHVRRQGESRTLCGHRCLSEDQWAPLPDEHPEDVSAVDRCAVCYDRLPS